MPPPPEAIPSWAWRAAIWVVGGAITAITTVLGWVGKSYIRHRDEQIEDLRSDIEEVRAQMREEHSGVEEAMEQHERKLDRILDKIDS